MITYAAPLHRYAAPLRRWLRSRGHLVIATRPPIAYRYLVEGESGAAMVPLAQLLRDKRLHVHADTPIVYTIGETMSSLVVAARRLRIEECRRIALTAETRTSAAYLAAILGDYAPGTRLVKTRVYSARLLLQHSPCALLLGDNALRARAQGLHVVLDIGEALWRLYQAPAVYAVTATAAAARPKALRGPPWPRATWRDVEETAKNLGMKPEDAERYHQAIRFDYNTWAILEALSLLRRGLDLLEKRDTRREAAPIGEKLGGGYRSLISM